MTGGGVTSTVDTWDGMPGAVWHGMACGQSHCDYDMPCDGLGLPIRCALRQKQATATTPYNHITTDTHRRAPAHRTVFPHVKHGWPLCNA